MIANLRAAAGNAETRATLEAGRLERDVEEQDAASLFGGALDAGAPVPPARGKTAATAMATISGKASRRKAKSSGREAKARGARPREGDRRRRARGQDACATPTRPPRKQAERAERAVAGRARSLAARRETPASLTAARAPADESALAAPKPSWRRRLELATRLSEA